MGEGAEEKRRCQRVEREEEKEGTAAALRLVWQRAECDVLRR